MTNDEIIHEDLAIFVERGSVLFSMLSLMVIVAVSVYCMTCKKRNVYLNQDKPIDMRWHRGEGRSSNQFNDSGVSSFLQTPEVSIGMAVSSITEVEENGISHSNGEVGSFSSTRSTSYRNDLAAGSQSLTRCLPAIPQGGSSHHVATATNGVESRAAQTPVMTDSGSDLYATVSDTYASVQPGRREENPYSSIHKTSTAYEDDSDTYDKLRLPTPTAHGDDVTNSNGNNNDDYDPYTAPHIDPEEGHANEVSLSSPSVSPDSTMGRRGEDDDDSDDGDDGRRNYTSHHSISIIAIPGPSTSYSNDGVRRQPSYTRIGIRRPLSDLKCELEEQEADMARQRVASEQYYTTVAGDDVDSDTYPYSKVYKSMKSSGSSPTSDLYAEIDANSLHSNSAAYARLPNVAEHCDASASDADVAIIVAGDVVDDNQQHLNDTPPEPPTISELKRISLASTSTTSPRNSSVPDTYDPGYDMITDAKCFVPPPPPPYQPPLPPIPTQLPRSSSTLPASFSPHHQRHHHHGHQVEHLYAKVDKSKKRQGWSEHRKDESKRATIMNDTTDVSSLYAKVHKGKHHRKSKSTDDSSSSQSSSFSKAMGLSARAKALFTPSSSTGGGKKPQVTSTNNLRCRDDDDDDGDYASLRVGEPTTTTTTTIMIEPHYDFVDEHQHNHSSQPSSSSSSQSPITGKRPGAVTLVLTSNNRSSSSSSKNTNTDENDVVASTSIGGVNDEDDTSTIASSSQDQDVAEDKPSLDINVIQINDDEDGKL